MKEEKKGRFLHQEWYEAFGRGEDLEFRDTPHEHWRPIRIDFHTIDIFAKYDCREFRLKPQTIQIGTRTIVKPISVKPDIGTRFYLADIAMQDKYNTFVWNDRETDSILLGRGICHLTKEDAVAMTDAILELMK